MLNRFVGFRVTTSRAAENRDGPQSIPVCRCGASNAELHPGSVGLVFSLQKTQHPEQSLR